MRAHRRLGLILLFSLLVSVYTLTNAGRFHIIDETSLFAVTESLGQRGEVDTNAIAWTQWVNSPGEVLGAFGRDGQVYSKKGPAPAFLATPWYLLWRAIALADIKVGLLQGALLWNGLLTAFTAVLVWLAAGRLGYGDRPGAALGLLFGLTTIAWPYANHFFGEPLSALSLLACFYGFLAWRRTGHTRWTWVAGIGAGMALATVTAHALAIAVLAVYGLWVGLRQVWPVGGGADQTRPRWTRLALAAVGFIAPLAVAGALLLAYNRVRFGDLLATGYHFESGEGFTTPFWQGFWGLVISPYRGIFWHTPLFFVSLYAIIPFTRRHRAEGVTIAALSAVLVALYSLWWMWWGGFAWGPRFLVPLTPFWVLILAPIAARLTDRDWTLPRRGRGRALLGRAASLPADVWALLGLAGLSFLVQVLAVTVNYVNYEIEMRRIFETDWEDPLAYGPPAQSLSDFAYSPVIGQWRMFWADPVANSDLAWLWASGNVQWLVVGIGAAVLVTLLIIGALWWRAADGRGAPTVSAPLRWLAALLPFILILTWMGAVSHTPHYGEDQRGYRAILSEICATASPDDVVVTVAPYAYQIPMNWMGGECRMGLPVYGYAGNSLRFDQTQQVMASLLSHSQRIWFVTGGLAPNDPDNMLEQWLSEEAYKADDQWYDDFRLLRYATPSELQYGVFTPLNVPLIGEGTSQINLLRARVPTQAQPGEIVPVEISYLLDGPNPYDLRWFVQILSPEGLPAALLDTAPMDGYVPFSALPAGQELIERAGLQIPEELAPGDYLLIAGLYNPASADAGRLRAPDGSDFVILGVLRVGGEASQG